jgi:4-deoxy-L-threo-5-hexosulose-uronate ketol-isomerase
MEIRHSTHPDDMSGLDSAGLRERFVVGNLFSAGEVVATYSHDDRMVLAGVVPLPNQPLSLPNFDPLRSEFFCQRRELAVVCIGAPGRIRVDGAVFELQTKDVLYIGRGSRDVVFESAGETPATFYLVSATSGSDFPTTLIPMADAAVNSAGSQVGANDRIVHKYIHADGVQSSQLVLGITSLKAGNVWNSMPPHIHDRRTEVYLYIELPDEGRIFHVMGEPERTKHVVLGNHDVVISPSWSVHFGAGTSNYSFVWVMAGENQDFGDMDQLAVTELA